MKSFIRDDSQCDSLVGMQACGDVMIGQHGRSVHEAIPHICGAKAILTSLLVIIITSTPVVCAVALTGDTFRKEDLKVGGEL